jgi:hypothetical protein
MFSALSAAAESMAIATSMSRTVEPVLLTLLSVLVQNHLIAVGILAAQMLFVILPIALKVRLLEVLTV